MPTYTRKGVKTSWLLFQIISFGILQTVLMFWSLSIEIKKQKSSYDEYSPHMNVSKLWNYFRVQSKNLRITENTVLMWRSLLGLQTVYSTHLMCIKIASMIHYNNCRSTRLYKYTKSYYDSFSNFIRKSCNYLIITLRWWYWLFRHICFNFSRPTTLSFSHKIACAAARSKLGTTGRSKCRRSEIS